MPGEQRDQAGPLTDSQYVELLTHTQIRLRSYVLSLVRKPTDADDVVQNACMALWEKRREYDPQREFFRWACGIALVEVLRYRRKAASDRLMFSESLLNTLAVEYLQHGGDIDRRRDSLPRCIAKLSLEDQRLLETRYRSGMHVSDIAEKFGRPASTIYSALARIRKSLYSCVQAAVAQETHR